MKRLILVLTLAFVLGLTLSAYAETQNIKVSGDLLMQGISRKNFTLTKTYGVNSAKYDVAGIITAARLRIDADLTDNVAVVLRLLNERSWGEDLDWVNAECGHTSDVQVDLAYVTLKEFLYSPMTLTVGRQELHFGNELVIGDPDTNLLSQASATVPFDLSVRKAFDAVRVTLNYEPLIVDVVFSKIKENDTWWAPWNAGSIEDRDVNLYGFNALYDLTALGVKGTLEGYYFGRFAKGETDIDAWGTLAKRDSVNTVGVLVKSQITDDLRASLEGAYQFGRMTYVPYTGDDTGMARSAFAAQLMVNYALPFEKIKKYSPEVGFIYSYLSGDADNPTERGEKTTWNGWDPMFENQTPLPIINALFPNTQMQAWIVNGSMKPWEDVTLSGAYGYFRLSAKAPILDGADRYIPGPYGVGAVGYLATTSKDAGHAFDLSTTYDYTEDVQFGLSFGYFDPGRAFAKDAGHAQVKNASQMIGSMKVTF